MTSLRAFTVLFLASCAVAQTTVFADESVARGVLFKHVATTSTQTMGGGAAFFDYDSDGDDDLFVTSSDGNHKLFENQKGKFVDRTKGSGLPVKLPDTMGVIAGDYNQDGKPDLYVTNVGPNHLYTNLGGGKFKEEAQTYGVAGNSWSVSAAFADFDRDGDLDLYVGDYVSIMNFPYNQGTPNKLYVNVGTRTAPKFLEMAKLLGVEDSGVFPPARKGFPYPTRYPNIKKGAPAWGCTLSVSTMDYDSDGDQDILVGNDFGEFVLPNRLYRNDSTTTALKFTDVSAATGFSLHGHYNMGIMAADFDHDGDWDFYHSNLGDNIFQQNQAGKYVDIAAQAGPLEGKNDPGTLLLSSWGTSFEDIDNDTHEDLFVVNGFINGAIINRNDPRSTNHVWLNQGTGKFKRITPAASGMNDGGAGRGLAVSDINGDGRLDFYVMNNGDATVGLPSDRCRLFVHQGVLGKSNNWLQLRLFGWKSNREALGARVDAYLGATMLRRQVRADPVYQSSNTRVVHFGLGARYAPDKVTIDWPSGMHQELIGVPGNQTFPILEPRVTMDAANAPVYQNGKLSWTVQVTNQTSTFKIVDVTWLLLLGKGGPLVLTLHKNAFVAANGKTTVTASLPLPASVWSQVSGLKIEQRAYVVSDGAVDSRMRVDTLK